MLRAGLRVSNRRSPRAAAPRCRACASSSSRRERSSRNPSPTDGRRSRRRPRTVRRELMPAPLLEVARELIGCVVEHDGCSGTIVETEAYHESEPACHAFVGVTPRTRTLFGEPGIAYVYRSYGIHALLNAVCEPAGVGAAVLIRALEPLEGIEKMRARRSMRGRGRASVLDGSLCSGPGKLTQALGIELAENGTSLVDGPVTIRSGTDGRVLPPVTRRDAHWHHQGG